MNEGKLGHLEKASVLAASDDPKDQDKAREIKTRFDYESLKRQIGSKKKHSKPAVKESMGGGVPLTPQELEIQKKMSKLNVRLAKKRSQQMQKAKIKDTETAPEQVKEGSLHKWFKGSKSKDGKAGWVNVKTGGTCASDEPGEGTPKCVSSSKRASMTKAERDSASRRKKAADPNQQSKSGAAKPTYVATDKKKKTVDEACWKGYKAYGMKKKGGKMVPNCKPVGSVKKEEVVIERLGGKGYKPYTSLTGKKVSGDWEDSDRGAGNKAKKRAGGKVEKKSPTYKAHVLNKEEVVTEADKKGKGSGSKDACYHKVKASAKVWPSAYASGRLVQCRKKGASNYGNKSEEVQVEGAAWTKKAGKKESGGLNEKGRKSYERENPGSDLKAPSKKVGNPRRASFCARMKGMKKKLTSAKTARDPDSRINKSLRKWNCEYEPQGNLIGEEGYDRMRDDRLVKYGIGHDGSDRKSKTNYIRKPDTPEQKKRRQAASDRAYSSVVASLKKKYGDGVMTRSKKVRGGKEVK